MALQVYVQQNRGLSSTKWTNPFKKQMHTFTARWLQPSVGELGRARGSLSLQRQSRHSNPTKGKILVHSLGVSKKEHLALVTVLSLQILSKWTTTIVILPKGFQLKCWWNCPQLVGHFRTHSLLWRGADWNGHWTVSHHHARHVHVVPGMNVMKLFNANVCFIIMSKCVCLPSASKASYMPDWMVK